MASVDSPALVCHTCGVANGVEDRPARPCDAFVGRCELCGRPGIVVEVEAFGGLRDAWREA